MGYLTSYGTIYGQIPQTAGRVFWVAPSATYTVAGNSFVASDGNDGLSPERAFLTLDYAVGRTTASVGDVIVLLPGAHSWSASVAVDVAGITIMGLPSGKGHPQRQRASVTTSAADEIMNITAADVEIAYLHFIVVTAQNGVDFSNAADRLYVHNCSFDMFTAAESTSTKGLVSIGTSGGVANLRLEDVYFETLGGTGAPLDLNDVVTAEVERATFRHRGSTALADAVVSATGAIDVLFDNCRWIAGTSAVITDCIDWTGNTTDGSLQLRECFLSYGGTVNASADLDVVTDLATQIVLTAAGGTTQYPTWLNAS